MNSEEKIQQDIEDIQSILAGPLYIAIHNYGSDAVHAAIISIMSKRLLYQLKNHSVEACESCMTEFTYSEKHDCYFCKDCDVWQEKSCGDNKCIYCIDRPEKPSLVKKSRSRK